MTALLESGTGTTVTVDLVWQEVAHPEVQMFIQQRRGPEREWVFARELLADGLRTSAGAGDVRVQPDPAGGTVHIALLSNTGSAVLAANHTDLQVFLDRTLRVTPLAAPVDVPDPEWFGSAA